MDLTGRPIIATYGKLYFATGVAKACIQNSISDCDGGGGGSWTKANEGGLWAPSPYLSGFMFTLSYYSPSAWNSCYVQLSSIRSCSMCKRGMANLKILSRHVPPVPPPGSDAYVLVSYMDAVFERVVYKGQRFR